MMQAIPTKYKSVTFRSRLEARWAVFFDGIGIKWRYEPEGYNLNGIFYLIDFYLPTFNGGCWVEVKPEEFNEIEFNKANLLVIQSQKPLIKAIESPSYKIYQIIFPDKENTYTLEGLPNTGVAKDRMFITDVCDLSHLSDAYIMAIENANKYKFNA